MSVSIPDGYLLLQAGKQLEYLTGGCIKAGYHEVTCSERTIEALKKAKEENKSLWRISSTMFVHVASDLILKPINGFENSSYEPILAGDQVSNELRMISLK
ncbi:hypothetical protein ROZALSC1DRAFT_25931 [Rozella allomycis CSF55]|uniref:Uncharacterized protein n=1 Tax=Rozella allomycis (strain CSF55) TaxID=988480 RepID=A0A4P9Y9M5_ROZAC|nr:hypothetical protein ROZALSC1DRAFT_25931 [Rozella allomycis CSF55]